MGGEHAREVCSSPCRSAAPVPHRARLLRGSAPRNRASLSRRRTVAEVSAWHATRPIAWSPAAQRGASNVGAKEGGAPGTPGQRSRGACGRALARDSEQSRCPLPRAGPGGGSWGSASAPSAWRAPQAPTSPAFMTRFSRHFNGFKIILDGIIFYSTFFTHTHANVSILPPLMRTEESDANSRPEGTLLRPFSMTLILAPLCAEGWWNHLTRGLNRECLLTVLWLANSGSSDASNFAPAHCVY